MNTCETHFVFQVCILQLSLCNHSKLVEGLNWTIICMYCPESSDKKVTPAFQKQRQRNSVSDKSALRQQWCSKSSLSVALPDTWAMLQSSGVTTFDSKFKINQFYFLARFARSSQRLVFRERGCVHGQHQRRLHHRGQWTRLQSQIWAGWLPMFLLLTNVNNTYFRPCGFTMTQAEVHSLTQSQSTVSANPYLA